MNHHRTGSGPWITALGQQLLRHFRTAPTVKQANGAAVSPRCTPATSTRTVSRSQRAVATRMSNLHPTRQVLRSPLRVIRVVEAGQAPSLAGRILMSGRMADVCAELDRMVEREAAMQPGL